MMLVNAGRHFLEIVSMPQLSDGLNATGLEVVTVADDLNIIWTELIVSISLRQY